MASRCRQGLVREGSSTLGSPGCLYGVDGVGLARCDAGPGGWAVDLEHLDAAGSQVAVARTGPVKSPCLPRPTRGTSPKRPTSTATCRGRRRWWGTSATPSSPPIDQEAAATFTPNGCRPTCYGSLAGDLYMSCHPFLSNWSRDGDSSPLGAATCDRPVPRRTVHRTKTGACHAGRPRPTDRYKDRLTVSRFRVRSRTSQT